MAFVRLRDAVVLESALDTRVPVRFIFILIGPTDNDTNYHECGRAMAALLADKVRAQATSERRKRSRDDVCSACDICTSIFRFLIRQRFRLRATES